MEDLFGGAAFGEGFVGEADSVEADVFGEGEEVFGDGVAASVDEGAGAGGFEEGDAGTGGAAEFEFGVLSGSFDDVDDVLEEDIADVDIVRCFHGVDEVLGSAHGVIGDEVELGSGDGPIAFFLYSEIHVSAEDFFFFFDGGVIETVAEHEAIELGFGEFEGSRLLDGVLRRDDEEGCWEGEGFAAEGHFSLLHRFEKSSLDLGRCAVDLIGEEEVGENGAAVGAEFACLAIEDLGSEDVGGEEVDGELDATEVEVEGFRDRVDQKGLSEAGHAFQQEVAGGEEGDDGSFNDDVLSDHDFADALADVVKISGDSLWRGGIGAHKIKCGKGIAV